MEECGWVGGGVGGASQGPRKPADSLADSDSRKTCAIIACNCHVSALVVTYARL